MNRTALVESNAKHEQMYMAIDLGTSKWSIGFSNGVNMRYRVLEAETATKELAREVDRAKESLSLREDCAVICVSEAGLHGFWVHRFLESVGIESLVVNPGSLPVARKKRRAKTDRLDVESMLAQLANGTISRDSPGVVNAPSESEEDARHLNRCREQLKSTENRLRSEIWSVLRTLGVPVKGLTMPRLIKDLKTLRQPDGRLLPKGAQRRLQHQIRAYQAVHQEILKLERRQVKALRGQLKSRDLQQVYQLQMLAGLGVIGSWTLVFEFFGWRKFRNRRQVAAAAGLSPTPYSSDQTHREQGISKAGNRRVRSLMVQLAWYWLRFQPESELSRWYFERYADNGKRMRKIGIVALARKLLVALWKYLEHGTVPAGARFLMAQELR